MVFAKEIRERVRRGRVTCSVRFWTHPHVKIDGRYPMDEGHIVVDTIEPIAVGRITRKLAQASGFESVAALMKVARHGKSQKAYLVRFRYLRPGAWDTGS
jgi:hypothetical protein